MGGAGEGEEVAAGPSAFVMRELLREEAPFMMLLQTGQVGAGAAAAGMCSAALCFAVPLLGACAVRCAMLVWLPPHRP